VGVPNDVTNHPALPTGPFELNETKSFRISADSELETVVLLMSADPEPRDDIAFA
jgi:hypothetical protein